MSNEKEFRFQAGVRGVRARLQRLEVENVRLQKEVDFLRGNPMIAKERLNKSTDHAPESLIGAKE